jgi:hypothetical protein
MAIMLQCSFAVDLDEDMIVTELDSLTVICVFSAIALVKQMHSVRPEAVHACSH